jgi:hypothetical protein
VKKREHIVRSSPESMGSLCALCKGDKLLCGKSECPILAKYRSILKIRSSLNESLEGSSPPSIFVGRNNYPKVNVGPMAPPFVGDTEIMENPEEWLSMDIHEFIDMRISLVRGKRLVNVNDVENRYIISLQEMIISEKPVLLEEKFIKRPRVSIPMGDEIPPYGPSGELQSLRVYPGNSDRKLEKVFSDIDMNASDAVMELYNSGINISRIQRVFSAGMLGIGKYRKLVPTRWSITAVDSTISQRLVDEIKDYETIDSIEVYESRKMENIFVVILFPRKWAYELVEGWYPGTLWNPYSNEIFIISDHEFYLGRKDYAEIGGCYYSARLAVAEHLLKRRRQAMAIVLREALPSYILPVGVWNVRENVRNALSSKPLEFDDEQSALNYVFSRFHIPREKWIKNSKMLDFIVHQGYFHEMY